MNFWGGVLFLLPTFSLSITGGRSNVVRLLDSAMGLGSVATSPEVEDKCLDVIKNNTYLIFKLILLVISAEQVIVLFIFAVHISGAIQSWKFK